MSGSFELAQARIQARHGERPAEAVWRRLAASATLGHFLEAARSTGLRRWIEPITEGLAAVEIDRSMRAAFVSHVEEVSSWVPLAWAPAVLWVRAVPSLPLGESEPGPFRGRWPFMTPPQRRSLEDLLVELERHRAAMGGNDDADGWALRAELDARVTRLFRLHAGGPAAPFCHLTLVALDLERLRGALLRRALFPDLRSEASWA